MRRTIWRTSWCVSPFLVQIGSYFVCLGSLSPRDLGVSVDVDSYIVYFCQWIILYSVHTTLYRDCGNFSANMLHIMPTGLISHILATLFFQLSFVIEPCYGLWDSLWNLLLNVVLCFPNGSSRAEIGQEGGPVIPPPRPSCPLILTPPPLAPSNPARRSSVRGGFCHSPPLTPRRPWFQPSKTERIF